MVKQYEIICKIKFRYFEYRYRETHFYTRMEAIGQLKRNIMQNHKHHNLTYYHNTRRDN